jgi:hypothetical protein
MKTSLRKALLGGIAMVALKVGGRMPPVGLVLPHGLLAATALVLLALGVLGGAAANGLLTASLVIFVLAAVGGFLLLASHLRTGDFPLAGALAHGGAAVIAFLLLLAALFL